MGRRPLAAASAAFAAGVYLGTCWTPWAALGAAALCGLAGLAARRWRRTNFPAAALCLLLAGAALGLLRGAARERPVRDLALDAALADPALALGGREPLVVEGDVLASEPRRSGIEALIRIQRREARPGGAIAVPGRRPVALVTVPEPVHRGERVRLFVRLHLPSRALNPGGRDRRHDLELRGISYEGVATEPPLVLARGPEIFRALDELRARFTARCVDVCTTQARGALVAALGVGDRSRIAPEVEEQLSASGLVHLLASAGLHLLAVAFVAREAAARLWLRLPWAGRARPQAAGALAALAAVAAEVLLLGAPWPAMRAGVGAALALSAPLFSRRADGLTSLAVAAAACAALDPAAAHDLALQLSVAGVVGMLLLTDPLRELLPVARPSRPRPLRRAAEWLLGLGCATAAATLCTAPLLAAAFHRVSLVSIPANTLALAPGLVAIPVAAFAVPLDALAPTLALPLLFVADGLSGLTLAAANLFSSLPAAQLRVASPGLVTCGLWLLGALLLAGFPGAVGPGSRAERVRPRARLLRAAAPFSLVFCVSAVQAEMPRLRRTLTATFFAVGQGDAALVQLPGGKTVLIDAGGDLRGLPAPLGTGKRDPGARDILPALAELGVSRLDVVVLTHPHPDHAGGLVTLIDRIPIGELWTTGEPGPFALGDTVRAQARARGIRLRMPEPGVQEVGAAGVRLMVFRSGWHPSRSTNDNSLVLRIVHGRVALLFAGDVEALAEAELAQGPSPIAADLLKAGHHGSRTSSTDAFLRRVAPAHVVFSVGEGNPFGFPHPDVVARAEAFGARTWRTDEGAVIAESDGERLTVRQYRRRD